MHTEGPSPSIDAFAHRPRRSKSAKYLLANAQTPFKTMGLCGFSLPTTKVTFSNDIGPGLPADRSPRVGRAIAKTWAGLPFVSSPRLR